MRCDLSVQRFYNRDRCAGDAARLEPAWETQGIRPPLAAGVRHERRRLPGLCTVCFRVSGKGDYAGSNRLGTARFPGKKGIMRRAVMVRAGWNPGARIAPGAINACSGKDNDK